MNRRQNYNHRRDVDGFLFGIGLFVGVPLLLTQMFC